MSTPGGNGSDRQPGGATIRLPGGGATIRRARHAGACYGVKRALKLVEQASSSSPGPVYTLGPLIHNPQVVEDLRARGVGVVESIDEVSQGAVVVRSHGVAPQVTEAALAKGLEVLDATCPHVSQAQAAASQLYQSGYQVIVVGERGHPEVEAISAHAGGAAIVVQLPSELPALPPAERIGVVAQTTQTAEAFSAVIEALKAAGLDPLVHDTICFATRQRQAAASQLAAEVDVMLVVGGRNSSNTTRLAEICAAACPRTYHLERADELAAEWFAGARSVGITAGASTPEDQIEAVERQLAKLLAPGADPSPRCR